jgi:hypothetical protein
VGDLAQRRDRTARLCAGDIDFARSSEAKHALLVRAMSDMPHAQSYKRSTSAIIDSYAPRHGRCDITMVQLQFDRCVT